MPSSALQVALRLQRQLDDEHVNLISSNVTFGEFARHMEEDTTDCDAPIFAEYVAVDGDDTIKAMTNFSVIEFDTLWAIVENEVTIAWTLGRGRKPAVAAKDAFFITLAVLKHFDTWSKHSLDFNIGISTLEKMVHRVIVIVEPALFGRFVKPVSMTEQRANGHIFVNYPHALYATDVKFQPAYRPSGRFIEQKVYYSAKHKLYGFKIECSVAPPGVAVDVSVHLPGSTSDLTILLDRIQVHRQMLRKQGGDAVELGSEPTQFPSMWAMLVDKGYQGAGRAVRTIQPKKKARGGVLDRDDLARNKAISSDRVLVENFFGRMCGLWNATYSTFKWNENRFDCVVRLCVALTNFHVSLMPLRAQDGEHYGMVLAKYQSMGDRVRTQRAAAQRECRARQQMRARPSPYGIHLRSSQRETQFDSNDEESVV